LPPAAAASAARAAHQQQQQQQQAAAAATAAAASAHAPGSTSVMRPPTMPTVASVATAAAAAASSAHQQLGSASGDALSAKLEKLSVADLKGLMKKYNVSTDNCFEKADLVAKISEAHARYTAKKEAERKEQEFENARSKAISDVAAWAKARTLPTLLNELNGAKDPSNELFVAPKPTSFSPVSRAYKKAIIKVHPDKHMHDPLAHVLATEKFKALNEAWIKFKKLMHRD